MTVPSIHMCVGTWSQRTVRMLRVGVLLAGVGCGGGDVGAIDGGADGGIADGAVDARMADAGPPDAGMPDAPVEPVFDGTSAPVPDGVRTQMTGVSWRSGCPVGLDELALLDLPHWGFDGEVHRGEMVVAAASADDVLAAFRDMFDERFPIEKIRLVDEYGADDDLSMEDNNTSAFNCRRVTGGTSYSQHSYGNAIDINPVQNPYVRGTTVLPPEGRDYLDRTDVRQGMIVDPGPALDAFREIGWGWGGEWDTLKDYQHFSDNGR